MSISDRPVRRRFRLPWGRLVVEVDGATHGIAMERERDTRRGEMIASCGDEIVRVADTDVFENLDGVLEAILAALQHRTTL